MKEFTFRLKFSNELFYLDGDSNIWHAFEKCTTAGEQQMQ